MRPGILAKLSCLPAIACVSAAIAGVNTWTMTGPDAGASTALAMHPTNTQIAIVATPRGLYRTANGGGSWTLVNEYLRSSMNSIAFDPANPNRVFAANGKLWRSNDAGLTFAVVTEPSGDRIDNVAFSSAGVLYAHAGTGQIYKSVNQGSTWSTCGLPGGVVGASTVFAVDPNPNPQDHLFIEMYFNDAPGTHGTWRSVDGCSTWTVAGTGNPGGSLYKRLYQYSVMPGNPNRVLAATDDGVTLSTDGGATWEYTILTGATSVVFDPTPAGSGNAYASMSPGTVLVSTDGGTNWNFRGGLRTLGDVRLIFDPQQNGRLFATTSQGTFLSTDGGANFALRASGIRAGNVGDFSASADGVVFAVFNQGASGVFGRSPSSGEWYAGTEQNLVPGIPGPYYMSHVAVAPASSTNLYAGIYNGLVVHSTDGTQTWSPPITEFITPQATVVDTVIDPDNAQVAWSATNNQGIWKTINGGTSWTQLTNGITLQTWTLAAARGSDVVYAAAGGIADLFPRNLYKSVNGGASWTATGFSTLALPTAGLINEIVIDPNDSNVVYVVCSSAIYKTANGGATWQQLSFPGFSDTTVSGYGLAVDPVYSTTLVVSRGVYGYGLARTVDGGASWEPLLLERTPADAAYFGRVVLQPAKPNLIIAAVEGANIAEYEVATDLAVSLGTLPAVVPTVTNVTANFRVDNLGPHGASPSKLALGFPAWATPTVPNFCTRAGQVLNCDIPPLNAGDGFDIPVTFATSAAGGTGQLTANLVGHETELVAGNNTLSRGFTATERADLGLSYTPTSPSVDRNGSIAVVAKLTNRGPSPSSATTLALQVPTGLTLRSATPSVGTCTPNGQAVSCAFLTLGVDATASVTLQLDATTAGTYTITGQADGLGFDVGTDQNASVDVVVRPVGDLGVTLAESDDPVIVDAPLTYTVTLRNVAGDTAGASVVVPVTGATLTGVSVTAGVTCSANLVNNVASCEVGSLAAGATAVGYVHVTGAVPGIATATATATYGGRDTNAGNNVATIGTTIRREGDVGVEISDSTDPVTVGASFTYTVTVRNAGPNAGAVSVAIPVTGAAISTVSSPAGTCTSSAGVANCTLPTLASGASAVITVTANAVAPGNATATATATFGGFDPVTANNSATTGTTIRLVGDVGVEIADSPDPAAVAVPFTYTVTVRNTGPNAGAVAVAIPVTGANISSATTPAGTCANTAATANCTLPSLASGASAVITVTAFAAAPGNASATVTATFGGFDPNAANNSATAETVTRAVADIGVAIAESADPVTAGGVLTYHVTLTTAGPSEGNVHLSVPVTGSTVTGATPSQGGTCSIANGTVSCDFAPLQFSPSTVDVVVNSATAGTVTATATAAFSGTDPDASNNTASITTTVNAAPSSSSSSGGGSSSSSSSSSGGGGGGGGRFDWLAVLSLGLLVAFRERRRA